MNHAQLIEIVKQCEASQDTSSLSFHYTLFINTLKKLAAENSEKSDIDDLKIVKCLICTDQNHLNLSEKHGLFNILKKIGFVFDYEDFTLLWVVFYGVDFEDLDISEEKLPSVIHKYQEFSDTYFFNIFNVLKLLDSAKILNEDFFLKIKSYPSYLFFKYDYDIVRNILNGNTEDIDSDVIMNIWTCIPPHHLKQEVFEKLTTYTKTIDDFCSFIQDSFKILIQFQKKECQIPLNIMNRLLQQNRNFYIIENSPLIKELNNLVYYDSTACACISDFEIAKSIASYWKETPLETVIELMRNEKKLSPLIIEILSIIVPGQKTEIIKKFLISIVILFKRNIFTYDNFISLKTFFGLYVCEKLGIFNLEKDDILNQETLDVILFYRPSCEVDHTLIFRALKLLKANNILNKKTLAPLINSQYCRPFLNIINALHDTKSLNESNITTLLGEQFSCLLTDEFFNLLFSLPYGWCTQNNFNELVQLAIQPDYEKSIRKFFAQFLTEPTTGLLFDNSQSVHALSVYESASLSAKKLFAKYSKTLKLKNILRQLSEWIYKLPNNSIQNRAAKSFVEKILKNPLYFFTDPESKISIQELLALLFLGIHDDSNRIGLLEDAEKRLIHGFYEIQRNYNLSTQNKEEDPLAEDSSSCPSGAFNMLINIMSGTLPQCEIIYLSKESARLKFPILIREAMKTFFSKLTNISLEQSRDVLLFVCLLNRIMNNGIGVLWKLFKNDITKIMLDEFENLYSGPQDKNLLSLINHVHEVGMNDLKNFQGKIESSEGYRQYCTSHIYSYSVGLFFRSQSKDDYNKEYICLNSNFDFSI